MTTDLPVVTYRFVALRSLALVHRVPSFLLGLSFSCWAHLTISREPFPGSPALHDIYLYAAPVLALVVIAVAWQSYARRASPLLIVGGFLWLTASLLGSREAMDPVLALAWTLWLTVALCLLVTRVERAPMVAGLGIGAAASLPLMLFQAAAQTTWPVALIQGWMGGELAPAVRGAAVLGDERWLRPYGLMPHPNIAGGIAAVTCVLAAWLWLTERRPWQLMVTAAAFSDTLLSFSRSAWLGAVLGLLAVLWLRRGNVRALLGAVVVPTILFAAILGSLVAQRTSASGALEDDSLSQRVYLLQTALMFWREHPLLGIGPAQFSQAEVNVYGTGFTPEPVHNAFFLVLAETGVLGLIGAGLVVAGVARRGAKANAWDLVPAGIAVASPLMLDHYLMTTGIGLVLVAATLSTNPDAAGHS